MAGLEKPMSEAVGILGPGGPDALIRFRGRAVGAMVCAGFGGYSMYWWTVAALPAAKQAWFYAMAGIPVIFAIWGIAQLVILGFGRGSGGKRSSEFNALRRFYAIRFGAIVAAEVAFIFLGGPVLGRFHRADLVPQWINVVVGIHFLPLGKLFKAPLYYGTAVAITLSPLISLLLPAGALRLATNAGGTALALLVTSLIILIRNPAYLPVRPPV
jgi:hypothetical protein